MSTERLLKYTQALGEATIQCMEENPKVFVMGEGIDDSKGTFGSTLEAYKKYGPARVFDMPIAEAMITGVGLGAAVAGMFPIMIHMRNEFLVLGMDQLVNHVAKWRYMFAGAHRAPLLIRVLVGRGWGQAAQHGQSLQALFAHLPGLYVTMPSNAYDAKGMMIAAVRGKNPVVQIEHRWLYERACHVPQEMYEVPLGLANVVTQGKDVTIVAVSHQVVEAQAAVESLKADGISAELIDVRSVRPLDRQTIIASLAKTGRLVVADTSHKTGGFSAEVASIATEEAFKHMKAPVARVTLPDAPVPCSWMLEKAYYPGANEIALAAKCALRGETYSGHLSSGQHIQPASFAGPF